MTPPFFTFLTLLLLFLPSQAFFQNSSLIHDLQTETTSYGSNSLASDAAQWTISTSVCSPSCSKLFQITDQMCGSPDVVFGGPNILGPSGTSTSGQYYERQYTIQSGITWNFLAVQFELYVFTSDALPTPFSPSSYFGFQINGVTIEPRDVGGYSSCDKVYSDGNGISIDQILMIQIQLLNAYPGTNNFDLKIMSRFTTDSKLHSLGLQDVQIWTINTANTGYTNFPCDINYYFDGSTCLPCSSYCSTCSGPTNDQCTYCVYPKYNYWNGSCYDDCPTTGPLTQYHYSSNNYCEGKCSQGYYWAYNDSCSPTCDPPYKQSYGVNYLPYCSTPCADTSLYLYPNGSCYSTCSSPLQPDVVTGNVTTINLCLNPCKASDGTVSYLFPNGTCTANCPSPLLTRVESDIKYCFTPCQSNQYLYSNSSCLATCPSPLVAFTEPNSGWKYCTNPCKAADGTMTFLYPNGTCKADCPSPLLSRTEPGVKYCFTPCLTLQYLFPNSTCFPICPSPLVPIIEPNSGGFRYCTNPCKVQDPTTGTIKIQFLYPNSTCSASCPTPLLSRTESDIKYCYTPCSTSQYLYPNGSCSTCDAPLVPFIESNSGGFRYCTNPCQTQDATSVTMTLSFLYPNSTCSVDCLTPLLNRTEADVKYCYTPCQNNQYLYPNSSCDSSCSLPFSPKSELNSFKYCVNPCLYSDSLFLYPDGTCNTTCPSPLFNRTDPYGKYCYNPCAANNTFLNENLQVCQSTCPAPSIKKNETIANYCKFPCEDSDYYYHTLEETCKATCDYPQQAQETPLPKLCISSLSQEEVKQVQQMASAASTAGTAANTGLMVFSVISSSDSTSACMGPLAKMLQYIRFMDITFPEKVQLMLQEQAKSANKKGFAQKILGLAIDTFPNNKLPGQFNTYNTTSNFFVNFWPSLFNLSVILLVILLIITLTTFTKGHPKLHEILKNITDVVKWNVFLITFCGNIGDIVLFTALEMQTVQFDSFQAVFSFIECIGMNVLTILIFLKILDVNSNVRKSMKNTLGDDSQKKLIEQKFSSYRALFECYKEYSYYQQIFLFVFILRLAIFNAVIGYLYNSPLIQAIISTILNILMLGYLVIKRPMKKLMNLIQQIILELVLLPFNICVLALAIMDHKEILEIDRRKAIGEVIFYINLITPMISLALMAAKFIVMGFELYKSWKLGKAQKASNKGKHKGIELSQATQIVNNTTEQQFSTQQNLHFETSQWKGLNENSRISEITDNSFISPESQMWNSRLNSPAFPKMKIKRNRPSFHQRNLMRLENSNQNNLQINDNFQLNENFQTLNYYSQQKIQQEESRDQEIPDNQDISVAQSEKRDGDMKREQNIQNRTNSLQYSRASKLSGRIY